MPWVFERAGVEHVLEAVAFDNQGVNGRAPYVRFFVIPRPPPNDHFAQRSVLAGPIVTVIGSTDEGSVEPSEPRMPDTWPWPDRSIWWSWTALASGNLQVRASAPSYGTTLEIYSGSSLAELTLLAGTNLTDGLAELRFPVNAGMACQIRFAANYDATVALELLFDAVELTHASLNSDGSFTGEFLATLDRFWRIDASTDFLSWMPVGTNRSVDGSVQWTDHAAGSFSRRFYRLTSMDAR